MTESERILRNIRRGRSNGFGNMIDEMEREDNERFMRDSQRRNHENMVLQAMMMHQENRPPQK